LLILATFGAGAYGSAFPGCREAGGSGEAVVFVLLKSPLITCHLCDDIFMNFIGMIRSKRLDAKIFCLYIPDDQRSLSIQEKQIRGFLKSRQIDYPCLVDSARIFSREGLKDKDLVIMNTKAGLVQKYALPMTSEQLDRALDRD
jgi:hypothetical protein